MGVQKLFSLVNNQDYVFVESKTVTKHGFCLFFRCDK